MRFKSRESTGTAADPVMTSCIAYPSTLRRSGQKQRVAITRCLHAAALVLCFDELTSALDVESIASVLSVSRHPAKKWRFSSLHMMKSFAQAMSIGTRVVKLRISIVKLVLIAAI